MFKRSGSLLLPIFMTMMWVAPSVAADESALASTACSATTQKAISVLRSVQTKLQAYITSPRLTAATGGVGVGLFFVYCQALKQLLDRVAKNELKAEDANFASLPLYAQICCCTGATIALVPWAATLVNYAIDATVNLLESQPATA